MLVKCPVCGAHVPEEVAVEIAPGAQRVCSLRCAEVAEGEALRAPKVAPLEEPPRRILVAVDGSGPSLRATRLAVAWARLARGRVVLLHAVDPGLMRLLPPEGALAGAARLGMRSEEIERSLREDAEAQLEPCRRICEAAGIEHATRIEVEAPARAIAQAAEEADLVVMGSRGLGALSGVALGSLSHRVIAATRKPVLVVH
jgi:nucleotide-binding universal stress UspA family protein